MTVEKMRICVGALAAATLLASAPARGEFAMDRSVMDAKYWEAWNDAAQAKIDADIEKYRKSDATVVLEGVPDGTEVTVEQVSHAFRFGASIFNFGQLGSKERNERYRALWDTLFNSATVSFYWKPLEPKTGAPRFDAAREDSEAFWNSCREPERQPHWRRPPPGPVIEFLRSCKRPIRIHGHPLVWANAFVHLPTWLWFECCPEEEKAALEKASGVRFPRPGEQEKFSVAEQKNDGSKRLMDSAWKKVFDKLSEDEVAALVPKFLKNLEGKYEAHVREIAERFGSRVDSWDVVNESALDFERFGKKAVRGRPFDASRYGRYCCSAMPADYAYKAFVWAQKYLPESATLSINDFHMTDTYIAQVKDLRANGAYVEMVCSQMHLMNPKSSAEIAKGRMSENMRPEGVAKRFRMLSRSGLPIHLSEITITAPDTTKCGEMVQAIIMRNLYRAWFSVEKMDGITWWNVVDNCGLPGEPSLSGLFTRDMKPKTAYYAMDDLINREWTTRTRVKAKDGKVAFRGFCGRYRLTWKAPDGTLRETFADVKSAAAPRTPEDASIRVGTYNIRLSAFADQNTPNAWNLRKDDLAALVRRLDLDVFGMQEVRPDQAQYLSKKFPEYGFVGEHREADRKSGEASPVVYRKDRFDAEKSGTFWLSETPDVPGVKGWGAACPRVCSYLVLRDKKTGRRFCFANTHTDHVSAEAREKGMLLILERMKDFGGGCPVVFTGDHNCLETDAPAKTVSKTLRSAVLVSETPPKGPWRTYNGWSWREEEPQAADAVKLPENVRNDKLRKPVDFGPRIDYIYVSPGIRVLDCATAADPRPGQKLYPSDHFPVVATISLP